MKAAIFVYIHRDPPDFEGLVLVDNGEYSSKQVNETVDRSPIYDDIDVI